ncbi:hypothetical protein MAHJHV45_47970 [Mycobacterium avium subsp. hominissuis]
MISKMLAAFAAILSAFMAGCNAHADTPKFPDINGYSQVNVTDYTIGLPNTGRAPLNTVYFLTPDGIWGKEIHGIERCTPGVGKANRVVRNVYL